MEIPEEVDRATVIMIVIARNLALLPTLGMDHDRRRLLMHEGREFRRQVGCILDLAFRQELSHLLQPSLYLGLRHA